MSTTPKSSLKTFEKSIETLEALVHRLEKGDLSLEEALKQFEKGVQLTRSCQATLAEAQQKVMILSEGSQTATPFITEDDHDDNDD